MENFEEENYEYAVLPKKFTDAYLKDYENNEYAIEVNYDDEDYLYVEYFYQLSESVKFYFKYFISAPDDSIFAKPGKRVQLNPKFVTEVTVEDLEGVMCYEKCYKIGILNAIKDNIINDVLHVDDINYKYFEINFD